MRKSIKKVLIVEDDSIIARNLSSVIHRIGFEPVAIVSRGKDVADAVKLYMPDIILMDILLDDDMDGITAAGIVKSFSDVPVIFITSNTQPEFVDKAIRGNPFGYIIKPFRDTEIKYAIMLADQRIAVTREIEKNQNEQKKLEDFYNTILNSLTGWVAVVNKNSDIVYVNEPFRYIFGDINSIPHFKHFINDEFSSRTGLLNRFFSSGERARKVTTIKNSDEEARTFSVSVSQILVEDGSITMAVMSGRDISELIEQSETLTSTREILNNIIQSVPTGIIITNSEGIISLTNETFETMSGFTFPELEGKDIDFLKMQPFPVIMPKNEKPGSKDYTPVELELKKNCQGSFIARILVLSFEKPLNEDFVIIYFITDISFEKKLELKQVRLQNHIESIVREMDDLSELLLETNVYNQSIKRGDIEFDFTDRNILKLIESGMTNRQIASRLGIAEITVKKRLSVIYSKIGINNKYQLIEYLHTNYIPDK